MKKISKRLLALMLAMIMALSMAACGNGGEEGKDNDAEELTYDERSAQVYDAVFGDFESTYTAAKEVTDNLSERWALMAIAEAKLLQTATFIPTSAQNGYYAISRMASESEPYSLWGTDEYRFHNLVVATDILKSEDRAEAKAKWYELRGTGTYEAWLEDFLTGKGYTLKDSYTTTYNTDPITWDNLATSLASVSEYVVNTYDGLVEYDSEGTMQPALAESWSVSDDGLEYTFKIRQGVKWVDSQGREVADVKADDFVAGMQHMMDAMGGLEYLVEGIIVNASEYINDEVTDFAEVGVKATDDYTLVYTLEQPTSYFMTMLSYSIFAPMSRSYYESQGGKFGAEYDTSAADYTYGTSKDTIAYCGPFLCTNHTPQNTMVFTANPTYWNAANTNIKTLTYSFNDGSDPTKAYNDMLNGTIDGCTLNTSSLQIAKTDGNFDKYHYVTDTNATTYGAFLNLDREAFANANDPTTVVSTQTDEDKARTNAAVKNVHFRRAFAHAFDRAAYNAMATGEDLKLISLRNTYTPWNFVSLEEEVTVDINGTATTFPAGTWYGEIMQAQMDADGVKFMVYNTEANDGNGSGDGYDGWYNPEAAKSELAIAVEELKEAGIEISKENPIKLDLPYPENRETYVNKANAMKQSVEAATDGMIEVTLVPCANDDEWYYTGYYTAYGYEANFDIFDLSGWGPDYGDPQTFLDTMLPDYAGYCVKSCGIY